MVNPEFAAIPDEPVQQDLNTRQKFGTASVELAYGGHDVFYVAACVSPVPMELSDPNLPDTPIVFCNLAFCEVTGYSEAEILGRNRRFLAGPDTDVAAIERLGRAVSEDRLCVEEVLTYRKDGSTFWSRVFMSPIRSGDGKVLYYFECDLDVTARRRLEAMEQQSQYLGRLAATSARAGHRFNDLMFAFEVRVEAAMTCRLAKRRMHHFNRAAKIARAAAHLVEQASILAQQPPEQMSSKVPPVRHA
jgi:PAS domain S-box-containing protein